MSFYTPLIRPYLLAYKNRIISGKSQSIFNREVVAILLTTLFVYAIYQLTTQTLSSLTRSSSDITLFAVQLLNMLLFGLFFLAIFSNFVAELGYFFMARDLPLVLSYPISWIQLYFARLIQSAISSCWMFAVFAIPVAFAFQHHFQFPISFVATIILGLIPLLIIAAAFSSILVTLFVNLFPAHRLKELLVVSCVIISVILMTSGTSEISSSADKEQSFAQLQQYMGLLYQPRTFWLPSRWLGELLASYFGVSQFSPSILIMLLISTALGLIALGTFCFDVLFWRGWMRTTQVSVKLSSNAIIGQPSALHRLLPFNSQFRAMVTKEMRMFLRDTTQSLQLLMLLGLSLIYLYQFRALKLGALYGGETPSLWLAILSIFNLSLGSSVVAAIATRFVYPTISQEGTSYYLIRCAPVSIRQMLWFKFWTWFPPISLLTATFVASGALAIQAPVATILVCIVLGIAMSVGIVGLSIGIGGVYARFDWDSPSEISASFGSLVYMFSVLTLISISIIPGIYLMISSCDASLVSFLDNGDQFFAQAFCYLIILFINVAAARKALAAAEQRLLELER